MVSWVNEIIELTFNANSGMTRIIIVPNAIIIEEEIRINHFVVGSNSISINK